MAFNSLLHPLGLDSDISLGRGGRSMLQQFLHQCDIVTVGLINIRCVPFSETMRSYALIAQIVTHERKLFLYRPLGDALVDAFKDRLKEE